MDILGIEEDFLVEKSVQISDVQDGRTRKCPDLKWPKTGTAAEV